MHVLVGLAVDFVNCYMFRCRPWIQSGWALLWLVVVTSTVRLDRLAGRVLVLGACSLSRPLCNRPVVDLHSGGPLGYTRVSTPAI